MLRVNARYSAIQCSPWADLAKKELSVRIVNDMGILSAVNTNYWFYGCTALAKVTGFGNLRGVAQMLYTFGGCTALAALDLTGLDPSALTSLTCTFGGCTALRTITVDSDWALPASGVSGSMTFYNCKQLVGGNGTVFSSGKTGYAMMNVDAVSVAGYLTAG